MPSIAVNPNITHVFVLMLENRSFDHMLGFAELSGTDADTGKPTTIDGIGSGNGNSYQGVNYPATHDAAKIMGYDPGHEFMDVVEQLCGGEIKYKGGAYPAINNSGFVSNYATTKSPGEGGATKDFGEIMKCYDSTKQLPVMMALAKEFAVCDHWYASLPGPTWPNRFFVHAASSGGLDHSPRTIETLEWETLKGFNFPNGTIYDKLDTAGKKWRIYHGQKQPLEGSIATVAALKGIHLGDTNPYEHFAADLKGDYPYAYTFIEPNYGNIINNSYSGGQSQHPMDNVQGGEDLIRSIYEAIRNSPLWLSSLLIITYDEHGGFYDHIPPPAATAPDDTVPYSKYNEFGFPFNQYGVRVPALVISAYTPKNIISHLAYDHASVPATLEKIFDLTVLTARDKNANTVNSLAALPEARPDEGKDAPPKKLLAAAVSLQAENALLNVAAVVPDTAPIDGGNLPGFLFVVLKAQMEKEQLAGNKFQLLDHYTETIKTRGDARNYIQEHLPGLLKGV